MDTNTAESDISSSHCPDRLHGMCPRQNENPKIHLWDLHMITSLCLQPYVLGALISLWERETAGENRYKGAICCPGSHPDINMQVWGFKNGIETLFQTLSLDWSVVLTGLLAAGYFSHPDCHCSSPEPLCSVSDASFTLSSWLSVVLFHLSVLISPFLHKKPLTWLHLVCHFHNQFRRRFCFSSHWYLAYSLNFWTQLWFSRCPDKCKHCRHILTQQLLVCAGVC